jgi:hypothetical protein
LSITDTWAYDQSDVSPGAGWQDVIYDDTLWPTGQTLLYVESSGLPAPKSTPLTLGATTYYFRTTFNVDMPIAEITKLGISLVVDDGAIIYLNGTELRRVGIDDGAISHVDYASRTIGNAAYEVFTVPPTGLVQGDNLLAVEVHQVTAGSSDIVFGMAIDAIGELPPDTSDPLEDAKVLLDSLRITEIMYNPAVSSDYEFIELLNIGAESINLNGVRIKGGIVFTFPDMTLLPGEYVVVANNRLVFEASYPAVSNVAGEYVGNLSNSGEDLILVLPAPLDAAILRFEYDDMWYPLTDGNGYSLVIVDPNANVGTWDDRGSWRQGATTGGTPGSSGI